MNSIDNLYARFVEKLDLANFYFEDGAAARAAELYIEVAELSAEIAATKAKSWAVAS